MQLRTPFSLNKRRLDSHKGDYGHVFILAGSLGFTGAACLCAQGALLSGCGLVTLGIPKSLNCIVATKLTEVMTKPLPETLDKTLSLKAFVEIKRFSDDVDVLAIGPGLSRNRNTQQLIKRIVKEIDKPIVLDADGINAFEGHPELIKATVITPHPGEMARLIGKSVKFIQANRKKVAKEFSNRYNIVTVLKGYQTVVTSPAGKIYINRTGNPGMATGGVGDILTGIISALLAQGLEPFEAGKIGVYVHGAAGDLAVRKKGQISFIASDIFETLPKTFSTLLPA